ncbi:MAG: retroviral-like aspartic protease family protein [Chitinophagaceae bacterium]|nr:retroviral-like aspartic protease family protein [Chitinophagaceae bacterium]
MRSFIILFFILFSNNVFSQLKVSDLIRFNIGSDLFSSRKEISKLFSTKGSLYKSETFSSVFKYQFENTSFNYCDNADYEFLYVNDKLSNLDIQIRYEYNKEKNESAKYLKSIETLLNDFKENNGLFQIQPKLSTIFFKNVSKKIDSLAYFYNKVQDNEIEDIKYLEENTYFITSNSGDPRILFLGTSIMAGYSSRKVNQNNRSTKTIYLFISLQLTSNKYQQYYQKYRWGTSKYVEEKKEIDLTFENGVYKLPVNLNGVMTLDFTLDLGASDVSLSPDVFLVLYRSGTISEADFIGMQTYKFADGSTAKSSVFNLKALKIGDVELKDVRASISNNISSPLLLGQSALKKLPSYKIDNQNNKLIIE